MAFFFHRDIFLQRAYLQAKNARLLSKHPDENTCI